MDELEKGLTLSLEGSEREKPLRECGDYFKAWGLVAPSVEPLVLDFGLGEFFKNGLVEYWIANETEAGYCAKYLFVFDGQRCPTHRHHYKHETFFVLKGRTRVRYADQEFELGAGETLSVTPGNYHSFTGIGPTLLLELSTPCEIDDNDFEDDRIPIGKNAGE